MNTHTNTPNNRSNKKFGTLTAIGLALCGAISGVIQVTDEQSSQSTVVGIEHVTITCFALMVLLMIPMTHHIAGITGSRIGAWIVTAAAIPLAMLATSSNIRGEDYAFFPAVAVPTNLLILVGLIVTAVQLHRRTTAPIAIVVGLPLTWLIGLPLSSMGSGLILAGFWASFAWLIDNDRIRPIDTTAKDRVEAETPAALAV